MRTDGAGRLAPTPSGGLHLGNALAFTAAWLSARAAGSRVLLRVEDIDPDRSRPEIAAQQRDDLRWLGLDWDEEVPAQSTRDPLPWLSRLEAVTYRCTCTRSDARSRAAVYDGRCRDAGHQTGAVRLRMPDLPVRFYDRVHGVVTVDPGAIGDPILRRRDGPFAYPLVVVVDDLVDGVTEVVRGGDLWAATAAQIVIWRALGFTPPSWLHTPVLFGPDGRKLSKSHGALELSALRATGWSAQQVLTVVLGWLGSPTPLTRAIADFDPATIPRHDWDVAMPLDGAPPPGALAARPRPSAVVGERHDRQA